jgi:FtsZ-interacting cell division protein ZipA
LATELRWILAALSALLLAGIWWWGKRRSRHAQGNAELRESAMGVPSGSQAAPVRASEPIEDHQDLTDSRRTADTRTWGVPPLEPLSIRTADFEQVHVVDLPMTAHVDSVVETLDLEVFEGESGPRNLSTMQAGAATTPATTTPTPTAASPPTATAAFAAPASSESAPAATPQAAGASSSAGEAQRIVTVRVCAAGESRWAGTDLMAALENHGLAYGRYHVFHRKHADGRTLFCAASLIEPGTFDIAQMPREQYRGLTLFAVLPGPAVPLQTLEALIETAGQLAEVLQGTVQDSKGMPLSLQRVVELRDEVARFQAALSMG